MFSDLYNVTFVDIQIVASGGTIGPFQFVVMFNETSASPADALIAWWDYGSEISCSEGETFTIDFDTSILTIT